MCLRWEYTGCQRTRVCLCISVIYSYHLIYILSIFLTITFLWPAAGLGSVFSTFVQPICVFVPVNLYTCASAVCESMINHFYFNNIFLQFEFWVLVLLPFLSFHFWRLNSSSGRLFGDCKHQSSIHLPTHVDIGYIQRYIVLLVQCSIRIDMCRMKDGLDICLDGNIYYGHDPCDFSVHGQPFHCRK